LKTTQGALQTFMRLAALVTLGGSCPLQQFHCLSELITIHINISLRGAYIKTIVSLLHAFF
jgi:hypothetical protein